MDAYEVVSSRVARVGITTAELARRTGINSELLRRSLIGERTLKANELITLCAQLELTLEDFEEEIGRAHV